MKAPISQEWKGPLAHLPLPWSNQKQQLESWKTDHCNTVPWHTMTMCHAWMKLFRSIPSQWLGLRWYHPTCSSNPVAILTSARILVIYHLVNKHGYWKWPIYGLYVSIKKCLNMVILIIHVCLPEGIQIQEGKPTLVYGSKQHSGQRLCRRKQSVPYINGKRKGPPIWTSST